MTNDDLAQQWRQDLEVRGRTKGTLRSYNSSLRRFRHTIDDKTLAAITQADLKHHLAALREGGGKAGTLSSHFAALASFYEFMEHEGHIDKNLVPAFRKRYLDRIARSKGKNATEHRQLLSIQDARRLVVMAMDIRTRAVLALLFKTGIRREEASNIDVDDIDWRRQSITLKPHPKRTNCVVYFDDETGRLLKHWLRFRKARGDDDKGPLFTNQRNTRLQPNGIYNLVVAAAQRAGLHHPKGPMRERFSPHCCRHWFTTHLRRAGMPADMIAELRGDADARTQDIYNHIDHDELRKTYLAKVPRLDL